MGSKEYTQSRFLSRNKKNIRVFLSENFQFLEMLFSIDLNRCVFVIKKAKRKVQGLPQLQTAALPRHQEEEEIDKTKQAQTEQMH